MTMPAETRPQLVDIGLPKGVFQSFHKAKDFLTETVNTLTESAQQARESLKETTGQAVNTVTTATDKTADTAQQAKDAVTTTTQKAVETVMIVTGDSVKTITSSAQQAKAALGETLEQTKGSLVQTLQTAEQLKSTTSETIQTAISSSVGEWLQAHPAVFRLVQLLLWATNHPILSLVIFLFAVAIAWNLIKAFGHLLEIASRSLLQAPFKLGQVLIQISAKSLGNGVLAVKRLKVVNNTKPLALQNSTAQSIARNKQQRLAEIATRLEIIQKEQNELFQEVAAILATDKIDV